MPVPASLDNTSSPRAPAGRRAAPSRVVDVDSLPPSALCTTRQVAALSGFAEITLKVWRRAGGAKGPRVTWVEGRPRYRVADVRAWLSAPTSKTEAA